MRLESALSSSKTYYSKNGIIPLNDDNIILLRQKRLQSAEVADDNRLPDEPEVMNFMKY